MASTLKCWCHNIGSTLLHFLENICCPSTNKAEYILRPNGSATSIYTETQSLDICRVFFIVWFGSQSLVICRASLSVWSRSLETCFYNSIGHLVQKGKNKNKMKQEYNSLVDFIAQSLIKCVKKWGAVQLIPFSYLKTRKWVIKWTVYFLYKANIALKFRRTKIDRQKTKKK